eukprot:1869858-Prymnesium_polylepis.1
MSQITRAKSKTTCTSSKMTTPTRNSSHSTLHHVPRPVAPPAIVELEPAQVALVVPGALGVLVAQRH